MRKFDLHRAIQYILALVKGGWRTQATAWVLIVMLLFSSTFALAYVNVLPSNWFFSPSSNINLGNTAYAALAEEEAAFDPDPDPQPYAEPDPDPAAMPASEAPQLSLIPDEVVDSIASQSSSVKKENVQYYKITSKIHFQCARTYFKPSYLWNQQQLDAIKEMMDSIQTLEVVGVNVIGSASPEGSLKFNTYLAINRAARLKEYLVNTYPEFFVDSLEWNVTYEYEDWSYVEELLGQSKIKYRDQAIWIIQNTPYVVRNKYGKIVTTRKKRLQRLHNGYVWKRMVKGIFPYSRGAELEIIVQVPQQKSAEEPVDTLLIDTTCYEPACKPAPAAQDTLVPLEEPWRQPMLAVKTNLLFYAAYIPKYGWAPAPNIGLEFLPRHGHWTVGASLDIPWYRNYSNHKFFQIRNWQVEARRYFRKGDAQYWGWYAQAYIHTGVFGIGFNKEQGWEGESVGGGIGGGYVLPLTKNKHWKLEFNLQFGYMLTQYDPYVYGHPTNGEEDGLYYYNWVYDPDLFKERQYRHNWLGPTRVGVTLSYDLLYYPRKKYNTTTK